MPFGEDGDFSENALKDRVNGELLSDLGNLVSRVLTLAGRCESFDGKPELDKKLDFKKIEKHVEKYELHHAIYEIFDFIHASNKYINEKEPWKLQGRELENIIYNLLESLRIISILVSPFIPETAEKIRKQIGTKPGDFRDLKFGKFKGKPRKGEHLFDKV